MVAGSISGVLAVAACRSGRCEPKAERQCKLQGRADLRVSSRPMASSSITRKGEQCRESGEFPLPAATRLRCLTIIKRACGVIGRLQIKVSFLQLPRVLLIR